MYTFVYCTVTNNSLFDSDRLTYFFPAGQRVLNEGKSPTCELPYDVTVSIGVNLCDPGFSAMALCARNAHAITVHDVTTWSFVNLDCEPCETTSSAG